LILMGLAAVAAVGALYYVSQQQPGKAKKKLEDDDDHDLADDVTVKAKGKSIGESTPAPSKSTSTTSKASEKSTGRGDDKELHAKIEELDKQGKAFFKNKQFQEAAMAFTEAIDLIESSSDPKSTSTSLKKQVVTLFNNRSAMYEKGNLPELALEDCNTILESYDKAHVKARTRKLRILESSKDYYHGLVEVCALQLLFMQENRHQLQHGLPPKNQPPVPQSKLEELLQKVLPQQLDEMASTVNIKNKHTLPSDYTLGQLLKSYTGYNAWMAKAARDGTVESLKKTLDAIPSESVPDPTTVADRASIMLKIGRRQVYDQKFADARQTFLEAYDLVKEKPEAKKVMKDDDYARLLEWVGMVKHWTYDLDGAAKCYQECIDLEPVNAEIMVKKAGVSMDAGKHDVALNLFEKALIMDPDAVDALLHRANLRMLQSNLQEAQNDLEKCVKLRPNHVLAHLRLAAVLTSKSDPLGAKKHLEKASQIDPDSSEVQSYQGELYFTQNEFGQAKEQFEKAIKLCPKNPTPYVNAALACLNSPPEPGKQLEVAQEAVRLLEKAIEVDPQFQAAYIQLGQLKLGMAQDLQSAKDVLQLYEKGLSYCRTKDEMKDLCSMKILAQAQVDAAEMLKMETFSVQ